MHLRTSLLLTLPLLALAACQDDPAAAGDDDGITCEDGTIERDGDCVPASARIRLTHLDVRYDTSKPVFVNNRVPITFGISGENLDSSNTDPRNVSVMFSFVEADPADPDNPLGCASSSIDVEVPGDGTEVIVDGFIWPTTLCEELAGKTVNLQVDFDGGSELAAELGSEIDAPTVNFSEALRGEPINQLCRASLEGDPELGCVHTINLQATPTSGGKALVDVRYALSPSSSVAVVPLQTDADVDASLVVMSRLTVNGRDPYFSQVDPELIPPELMELVPTIEEDLKFGFSDAELAALSELPGTAKVSYTLRAASDPDTELPLGIRDPNDPSARVAELAVDRVVPGTANDLVHELFIEGETLEAVSPGGIWADESNFIVRGCFVADFDQAGNEGDAGLDDCRDVEIMLVHEAPPSGGASSLSFDKSFERSLGNDRVKIESKMSTQNRLSLSGASSHSEGEVALRGKLGKSYELKLARAYATAVLDVDPTKNSYDIGVEAFNQEVFSFSDDAAKIEHTDEFSVAKSATVANLGFGFGPVTVGFKINVGGTVGIETEDSLELLTDSAACQDLLQVGATGEVFEVCGHMSRVATPSFGLTGKIEGGINLKVVKAGVAANLRFITTSFPLAATLVFSLTDKSRFLVRGDATWDMELVPLSGDVAIVGKVGIGWFSKSLKVNLFKFSTPTITSRLLNVSMEIGEELK